MSLIKQNIILNTSIAYKYCNGLKEISILKYARNHLNERKINIFCINLFFLLLLYLPTTAQNPNIIFILADDLGYGDIEPYGQKIIKTPNLNRLAKEGIRFTNHYAGAPVCAPSRSTLMTGMHTGHTPIRGNQRDNHVGVEPLAHNVKTVAEMLKASTEYTTALYGRWHLGGVYSNSQPHQRGFDEFFGPLSKYFKPLNTYYRPDLYENGDLYIVRENNNGAEGIHREDLITEKAFDFIKRNKNNPFFLYLAYSFVHAPLQPVPGEEDYSNRDWPQSEIDFAHNVTRLDRYVGQFIELIDELAISENTLLIFTSDNGPHMEGHNPDFFNSNGTLRGYKRDLYEGGIRVPFIARWPGKIKFGTISEHPSAFWDLMPTLSELTGARLPKQTDGISYLPALLGKEQSKHEYLYWEFNERTPRQAIRMEDWKGQYFIEHDRFELYNLSEDIGEKTDLATTNPEIVKKLKLKMQEAHIYNHRFPITKAEKYIQISPRNQKYLQYEDGTPFIPIGPNICWSRATTDPNIALAQYNHYFKQMADNGANFTRIWLGAPLWEIEHKSVNGFDMVKTNYLLDSLVNLANQYSIKLKFCIHNFRTLTGSPPIFEGSVSMGRPIYHKDNGGPFESVNEYFNTEKGKDLFLERMYFLSNQYGSNPSVFGWELWNEINAVRTTNKPTDILEWTSWMLPKAKEIFPRHLVMQSMGSFDRETARDWYKKFCIMDNNDIAQIHRYLDPGAELDVCKGPMDILAADATRELLSYNSDKPVIVSEVGAVEANHAGPSKLYELDSLGILLHDLLFAPFFSGAAAPGQSWHWHHYVDKHDLWWHLGRFSKAIKNVNPISEGFEPTFYETKDVRVYSLNGKNTTLIWCRDVNSNWQTELIEKITPDTLNLSVSTEHLSIVDRKIKTISIYDPWKDKWTNGTVSGKFIPIPPFTRSIVLKITH